MLRWSCKPLRDSDNVELRCARQKTLYCLFTAVLAAGVSAAGPWRAWLRCRRRCGSSSEPGNPKKAAEMNLHGVVRLVWSRWSMDVCANSCVKREFWMQKHVRRLALNMTLTTWSYPCAYHEGICGSGGIAPLVLTSTLDGGEWSVLELLQKEPRYPLGPRGALEALEKK